MRNEGFFLACVGASMVLSFLPDTDAFAVSRPSSISRISSISRRIESSIRVAGVRMSNVKGVASNADLLSVVQLAKKSLPQRPDGVLVCVQYSSVNDVSCMAVDSEFDRLSEDFLDCIFLRCYKEYEGASMTMAVRDITSVPTFEVFYRGDMVSKILGSRMNEVKERLRQYGFVVSKTDLFGQSSKPTAPSANFKPKPSKDPWDSMADEAARIGRTYKGQNNPNAPVRTTMSFYPGGMSGMGQSAADNVRDKGSTMDEWQNARNNKGVGGEGEADAADGSPQLRGVGQPVEKPAEFWKNRFEALLKAPPSGGQRVPFPPNFEKIEERGDAGGSETKKEKEEQTPKDLKNIKDQDDDIFKKIWND